MNSQISAPDLSSSRPPLALLVDRDVDTRSTYAECMRRAAWEVEEAVDGPEALAKAIARPPEVVVTDTRLAGISGYDLCRLLRRDIATHEIPVVVVTAGVYKDHVTRAEEAGADAVLIKPCPPEDVLAAVRDLVTHSQALRTRSVAIRSKMATELVRSAALLERSRRSTRKLMLSHAQFRCDTATPPTAPPALICPQCDQPLFYRRSHIGGVSQRHLEQWDYFECGGGCGTFQYRERTRKLRKVS
jgi:two-component system cell cycle response regulator DivK